jgi:glyoxylase I family protein
MQLEHVALNHPDPIKASQWYVDNLEMEVVRASDQSPYVHFLADKDKRGLIELYSNPKAPVPDYAAMDPLILHIAFSVDDIEGIKARLVAAGAIVERDVTSNARGDQLLMVRDPWGVCLQFVKRNQPYF